MLSMTHHKTTSFGAYLYRKTDRKILNVTVLRMALLLQRQNDVIFISVGIPDVIMEHRPVHV